MAVTKRLRFEILRRDNHQCRYCGGTAPDVPLRVDHVVPVALGGSDDPSNLVTACEPCNSGKSSVPADAATVANVADDALRWAAAMRQAAEEIAAEDDSLEAICGAVQDRWRPRWMPADYRNSIYAFVKAGLTEADLVALVDVALSARGVDDRFAYFCGCCWKRVKKRQERAAEIVAMADAGGDAPPTPLVTRWTLAEIDALVADWTKASETWGTAGACCAHRPEGGHCGDPVCKVIYAGLLIGDVMAAMDAKDRAQKVLDEAEALLDG